MEDHIIERLIPVFRQTIVDILMKYAQSLGDTLIDGLFINLYALGPDILGA